MPSSAVALSSDKPLTPAMLVTVWEIAAAMDEKRVPAELDNAIWLEVPTARLRGEGSRSDNVWLRECLERLTGIKLSGEYKGDPWGAVVLAEWHIEKGGTLARLLIPPAGVHALRAPATFTKIESHAAHRLTGHGRRLYAILSDKKRLGQPTWTFKVEDIRHLMGVHDMRSYDVWGQFRKRVLNPAVEAINDYGTVNVKMTPIREGRSIVAVRFDWKWKDPHAASDTATENDRHTTARRKDKAPRPAPPMIKEEPAEAQIIEDPRNEPPSEPIEPALAWWAVISQEQRDRWADYVGRTFEAGGMTVPRRQNDLARASYEAHLATGQARSA